MLGLLVAVIVVVGISHGVRLSRLACGRARGGGKDRAISATALNVFLAEVPESRLRLESTRREKRPQLSLQNTLEVFQMLRDSHPMVTRLIYTSSRGKGKQCR